MDIHELIRQMERAERVWPDDRPWAIQVLAGYLHIGSAELLKLFQEINPTLVTERDHVMPEDLRLLKAYCERELDRRSENNLEEKRKEQARSRRTIQQLLPQISELVAKKEHLRGLNTYIYLLGEAGDVATPEEKAQWYEEMGRLTLKVNRHPGEAARYFRSAVYALGLLEDVDGIKDVLETYEEDFSTEEAKKAWLDVLEAGNDSIARLTFAVQA